jgi:ABC-type multidrug transport system fused ATPase/permease subunit
VSFAYEGRAESLLAAADLELRRGEIVLLAGPSGAGKSTVASLLLGILRPQTGCVTVDGVDLGRMELAAWHRQLAWLPQHATMFRGTVHENIAITDRSASRGDVERAARLAGADGFIRDLRHGYETVIGDGGRGVSAGEARRIALARVLLRPGSLLILDEPTANLDAGIATEVFEVIARVACDRAILLIEHVPSRVTIADRVVRIVRGSFVVSEGIAPGAAAASTVEVDGASASDPAGVRL